jgi:hypothetical protein
MDRVPRAVRPLYNEYLTIGHILRHESSYLNMTRSDFISMCMFYSNGYMNPARAAQIYTDLMNDCGLPELEDN